MRTETKSPTKGDAALPHPTPRGRLKGQEGAVSSFQLKGPERAMRPGRIDRVGARWRRWGCGRIAGGHQRE
eukprot:201315-Heterocapsa_arctica.AAC.1